MPCERIIIGSRTYDTLGVLKLNFSYEHLRVNGMPIWSILRWTSTMSVMTIADVKCIPVDHYLSEVEDFVGHVSEETSFNCMEAQ